MNATRLIEKGSETVHLVCGIMKLNRTMSKEKLTYPQKVEASTVTGSAGIDYRKDKLPPVNLNINFFLI